MSEGYSRVMRPTSGKASPREDSFREIKKLIDEGYERFWSKPHRIHMRPISADHGTFSFGSQSRKEDKDDEFNGLTH